MKILIIALDLSKVIDHCVAGRQYHVSIGLPPSTSF